MRPAAPAVTPAPAVNREPAKPRPRQDSNVTAKAPMPTVVTAQLCRSLDTGEPWRCTPVSGAVDSGTLFFYTRLTSRTDTEVEHRWYRGHRLEQTRTLRIKANEGSGYRTYSRVTIGPERTGEWKVELRAKDGALLQEQAFTVNAR
jgi:DUF2914 family protein